MDEQRAELYDAISAALQRGPLEGAVLTRFVLVSEWAQAQAGGLTLLVASGTADQSPVHRWQAIGMLQTALNEQKGSQ